MSVQMLTTRRELARVHSRRFSMPTLIWKWNEFVIRRETAAVMMTRELIEIVQIHNYRVFFYNCDVCMKIEINIDELNVEIALFFSSSHVTCSVINTKTIINFYLIRVFHRICTTDNHWKSSWLDSNFFLKLDETTLLDLDWSLVDQFEPVTALASLWVSFVEPHPLNVSLFLFA